MDELIRKLDTDEWLTSANELYFYLKDKFQGQKGSIKRVRNIYDDERREKLLSLRSNFLKNKDISELDQRLNNYTSEIQRINNLIQTRIYYDLLNTLINKKDLEEYHPECFKVANFLSNTLISDIAKLRLNAIITRIITESGGQSNKANAGIAGEDFTKTIFDVIGLKENIDYKAQHKSKKGSDTDFVFPYVEDFKDLDVDIFMAVQFSSNDRARLVTSELKTGAKKYAVTGNGLSASSKNLGDIGVQIIEDYKNNNIQMVCFGPEIEREKEELKSKISSGSSRVNVSDNINKLDYIENFMITFSELAEKLQSRIKTF